MKSVRNIYDYFKQHKYNTIVMGASFPPHRADPALVGCDRLTIAPPLLKELQASDTPVVRKLIPASQILPRRCRSVKRSSAGNIIRIRWRSKS